MRSMTRNKVVVIGGGPAGVIAAGFSAKRNDTILLEKNEILLAEFDTCKKENKLVYRDCLKTERERFNTGFKYILEQN